MNPWFNPNAWAWLPGTSLGVLVGLWDALAGTLAPRGKAKGLILGMMAAIFVASLGMLVAAVVALASGQPYGVWYGLGLPGLMGVFLPAYFPMIRIRYRQAEERRMMAEDLHA